MPQSGRWNRQRIWLVGFTHGSPCGESPARQAGPTVVQFAAKDFRPKLEPNLLPPLASLPGKSERFEVSTAIVTTSAPLASSPGRKPSFHTFVTVHCRNSPVRSDEPTGAGLHSVLFTNHKTYAHARQAGTGRVASRREVLPGRQDLRSCRRRSGADRIAPFAGPCAACSASLHVPLVLSLEVGHKDDSASIIGGL